MKRELRADMLYLMDMDGTIYNEDTLFDGVAEFFSLIDEGGGRYMFLTNNSSRSSSAYVEKLSKMGIEVECDDFLTSTDATILYIKKNHPSARLYCVGTRSFVAQIAGAGLDVRNDPDEADTLLMAYDTELTYEKLYNAAKILSRECVYIATNPDRGCPAPFGLVPDCGGFCEALYMATGRRPHFIGKPKGDMLILAMEKLGYSPENTVMVGDRLYTDIASGINAGVNTVLVLSGETDARMAAESEFKADWVLGDIRDLMKMIM